MSTDVSAPPERFNFAQHLLQLNAGRPGKTAFIDDRAVPCSPQTDKSAYKVALDSVRKLVRR